MNSHSLLTKLMVYQSKIHFHYFFKTSNSLVALNPHSSLLLAHALSPTHSFFTHRLALDSPPPLSYVGEGKPIPGVIVQPQLKPVQVDQLCFCYIKAAGLTEDFNVLAVTHCEPGSTKSPVLFTDESLGVSEFGESKDPLKMLESLLRICKIFQKQTAVFPKSNRIQRALRIAQKLIPTPALAAKVSLLKESKGTSLIPTTLGEELQCNPLFNLRKAKEVLGTKDDLQTIQLLSKLYSRQ